jgi:predicted DsbA family dithiol-disulfide isomerase
LRAEYPDIVVEWRPYLLRPDMPLEGKEIPAEYLDDMEDTRRRLEKMADSGDMELVFSGRIAHSRRALEATEYASEQGRGVEFHRAVFQKLYGEGRDIGSWEILRAAARDAGLDADTMEEAVASGRFAPVLDTKLARAAELGIKAVPTYIINDNYRIVGAQPYEVFQEAITRMEHGE